jgi:hypothetical protein
MPLLMPPAAGVACAEGGGKALRAAPLRPLALHARPKGDGSSPLTTRSRAENQKGEGVMSFDSAVLVRVAEV